VNNILEWSLLLAVLLAASGAYTVCLQKKQSQLLYFSTVSSNQN